jgi:phage shock protein C
MAVKKLYRSVDERVIAGVCGGLGSYFAVDPTALRLLWVFITIFSGILPGVIVYILAWIIVPEAPALSEDEPVIIEMSGVRE